MNGFKQTECPNLLLDDRDLCTKNLVPGSTVYGERLIFRDGEEFRLWRADRSKMAAFIRLSGSCGGILRDDVVIYFGAASGTTVSHISDIVDQGQVYAVEISKRAFRELLRNCSNRPNIIPILGDARDRDLFRSILSEGDYLYVDIAQRDQVNIFVSAMDSFNCREGILMLKSRSINVAASPALISKNAVSKIENAGWTVRSVVNLDSYVKDHYALQVTRKMR